MSRQSRKTLAKLVEGRQALLEQQARELLEKAEPLGYDVPGFSGVMNAGREQALAQLQDVIERLKLVDKLSERVTERLRTRLSVAAILISGLSLATSVTALLLNLLRTR
jgi:hypothetical protein